VWYSSGLSECVKDPHLHGNGYTYIRKTPTTPQHVVINEAEAEIVRQVYRWCVEEQLSSYAIHQRLTVQGIPPRKASPRGGAQSSVREMLRDSLSKGEAYDNRTQPGDARRPHGRHGLKDRHPGNGHKGTSPGTVSARSATIRNIRICCGVSSSVGAVVDGWSVRGGRREAGISAPCAIRGMSRGRVPAAVSVPR